MTENPIQTWFESDKQLFEIVSRIASTDKDIKEQALDAFHQLSEHFNLPKYPDNFSDEDYKRFEEMGIDNPRSVFEETTLFSYLNPEEDPRSIVMVGLYNIKNALLIDTNECAEIHFGHVPKEYILCYVGNGFAGTLHFLQEGESWFDIPDVRSASKIVNR